MCSYTNTDDNACYFVSPMKSLLSVVCTKEYVYSKIMISWLLKLGPIAADIIKIPPAFMH